MPLFTVLLVVALGSAYLVFRASNRVSRRLAILITLSCALMAAFLFLFLHEELIDSRVRAYKIFYRSVQVGMSREQVQSELDRCYPLAGTRKRPRVVYDDPATLTFHMDTEGKGEPDAEIISLGFELDHVVRKDYYQD